MQKKKWQLFAAAIVGMLVLFAAGSYGVTRLIDKTYTIPAEIPPTKYPEKPITLIVPFSAGGGMDLQARVLESVASQYLGQPIVVVNKPGGSGMIGWNEVLHVEPDGYTLCMTSVDTLLPPLYGMTKYHYTSALAPIAQISESSFILAVNTNHPWKNVDDLIQYAKQHPGELKFGHGGIGTSAHILGEAFAKTAGIAIEQVPFRGGSESLKELLGDHIQILFSSPTTLKEQIKSGKLRALATTHTRRLADPDLSQIPTLQELGFDVVFTNWRGIAVAKNTPPEVQAKLAEVFEEVIMDPAVKKFVEDMGMELAYLGPVESAHKWVEDSDRLCRMMEGTGLSEKIRAQKQ